jgi:hypothetical protein
VYKGSQRVRLWLKAGPAGSRFGSAVAPAGDLDCDGIIDVLGGAADHDGAAGTDSGLVRVLSGADGAVITGLEGTDAGSNFGRGLSTPGDLDGDGQAEFLIGAPGGGEDGEGVVGAFQSPFTCTATGPVRAEPLEGVPSSNLLLMEVGSGGSL